MNRIIVVLSLLFIVLSQGFTQNAVDNRQLAEVLARIGKLENELAMYKAFYEEQKDFLKENYALTERKFEYRISKVQEQSLVMEIFAIVASALILLGIPGGILVYVKKAHSYLDQKMKTKIDNLISDNEGRIIEIIRKEEFQERIKRGKRIVVISDRDATFKQELVRFFRKFHFDTEKLKYMSIAEDYSREKPDLLIINNYNNSMDEEVKELMAEEADRDLAYLLFTREPMRFDKKPVLLGYANGLHTLYPRITELLSFQEMNGSR